MPNDTSGGPQANQPPPLAGYDAWSADRILVDAVTREGGAWIAPEAHKMGELVGSDDALGEQVEPRVTAVAAHQGFRAGHEGDGRR